MLCCNNQVQAAQDGDYTYTVTNDKATITKYTGAGGVVTIPSTLGGVSVISIGNWAFYVCHSLTSVSLPEGLTNIGENAFNGCSSLTSVCFPQGLTTISNEAFSYCTSLKRKLPTRFNKYRHLYFCLML
ncbi:leucine-rich repeat domain-containing protein [Bacteroides sp.]|uniref:leucine-rich repeat domain-containing protein n=1 Tax=Bacteroides sp. TaxID=29523 RepID=UPI0026280D8A|nr:leucine-rich repeat domain-containing protein [Bacteroides sp.]MDD3041153.1 leucine-rich repeat domain-containing protein [Bacteroides sp.]